MQLKMQDILNFSAFYETAKSQKLPMKTAYNLARLARAVETELRFYHEKFQAIVLEFAETDENGLPVPTADGNGIKLREGTESKCMALIEELQNVEITLPDFSFSIEDFGNTMLSTEEVSAIIPFIAE